MFVSEQLTRRRIHSRKKKRGKIIAFWLTALIYDIIRGTVSRASEREEIGALSERLARESFYAIEMLITEKLKH